MTDPNRLENSSANTSDTGTARSCIDCAVKNCRNGAGIYPPFCLTTGMDKDVEAAAMAEYEAPQVRTFTIAAAEVEAEFYCKLTRVEETVEFARRIGAKKLGIASCVGLLNEARTAGAIFRHAGFEVVGIACKCGAHRKVEVGIPKSCESAGPNMCNPILQAKYLNAQKTDLNIQIGLCVGHDSLFYKYSEAPVTTLIVKDRVLAHNPVGALYQAEAYYKRLLSD